MKKILTLVLLFSCFQTHAQTADSITLWNVLADGIDNFQIKQSLDYSNQAVDLQKQNLKTNFYPVIKIEAQASYQQPTLEISLPIQGIDFPSVSNDQYNSYLLLNQLIYDGGLTKSYRELLNLSIDENIAKSDIQEYEIKKQVATVFFMTLLLDKQIDIIDNQLKTLNQQLKIVEASVKSDVVTPVNRDIFLSEVLKVQQKLDEAKIDKQSALNVLNALTGSDFSVDSKIISPELSILNDSSTSPRLQLYDLQSQKLDLMQNQVNATRHPQVYAFGQAGYGKPGLNMLSEDFSPYFIVGVKFSWRIYDWNNAKRSRQIYSVNNSQVQIEKQNAYVTINTQKINILAQIESVEKSIETDKQVIELQEKIVKVYDSQLKNGIITSSDYIIEVNKLSQAQLMLELHKIQLEQLKFGYNNIY